tara:strand:+ start:27 stop:350 length:324 start_codon:yes stop_codon:yes gene_type:complete
MKVNSTNGAIMLLELVYDAIELVIPQLDDTIVKRSQYPRTHTVKSQALHTVALALELRQQLVVGHILRTDLSTNYYWSLGEIKKCPLGESSLHSTDATTKLGLSSFH